MKKILLIFGAGGALGKDVSDFLIKEDFSKMYLFDSKKLEVSSDTVVNIQTKDLSIEQNVEDTFNEIEFESDADYFLYSTVGGFAGGNSVGETSMEEWNKMLNLNLNISFLLAKHFIQKVKVNSRGSICFTSAMTSVSPSENKASYGTSKSALNYLVKTLAKECKNINISVNAIAPLVLDTKENREWVKDTSIMVSGKDIGRLINSIFANWQIVSGNIIELPGTLK